MTPLDFVPKSAMAVFIVVLMATTVKLHWDKNGLVIDIEKGKTTIAQLKEQHATTVAVAAVDLAVANQQHRIKEQSLQVAFDAERAKANATRINIATERDALRVRLSNAADTTNPTFRLSGPAAASFGQTAGGSDQPQLSSTVGGLVDEAARAEEIREGLLSCYRQYDRARDTLNAPPEK